MESRSAFAILAAVAAALGAAGDSGAAIVDPPHEDIFFLAEHLPEAAEEARYFSLPWPETSSGPGGWHPIVGLAGADVGADFARARGALPTLGVARVWRPGRAVTLFGFYGNFDVRGNSGEEILRASAVAGVPLDLPERALFSRPRGAFVHFGIGVAFARTSSGPRRWTLLGGLLLERLDLQEYRFDYLLLGGADAGSTGVLGLSGTNEFVTPYLGVGLEVPFGKRWVALPRAQLGVPLPPGEFETRLTGPGFDLSTASTGADPGKIGDGFLTLGAGLRDRVTEVEIDLGATVTFPGIQRLTHPGIDRGWLVSIVWRGR